MADDIAKCVEIIRKKSDLKPEIAIVLGSGLGGYARAMKVVCEIPYGDLPDFPVSTVMGHDGKFIIGYVGDVPVICMKGRVHYYEGYTPQQVVKPIRVMQALGAEILIVTNAAGGIKDTYHPGMLVLITDQISVFAPNPLIGPNDESLGLRFPDMTEIYNRELRTIVQRAAITAGIIIDQGVYCQLTGPSFETPAEIRMLSMLGGDLVGMSTCMETIAARHMGMKICGISLVTNYAAGISALPISQDEVYEAAQKAGEQFEKLVTIAVNAIHKDLNGNR